MRVDIRRVVEQAREALVAVARIFGIALAGDLLGVFDWVIRFVNALDAVGL